MVGKSSQAGFGWDRLCGGTWMFAFHISFRVGVGVTFSEHKLVSSCAAASPDARLTHISGTRRL